MIYLVTQEHHVNNNAMQLTFNHFNSLIILAEHFSSEKRCRDFITEQRWGVCSKVNFPHFRFEKGTT